MSKNETKQHFAEICECIWNKVESQGKLDLKSAEAMRKSVTNFAMVVWNMSLVQKSYAELQKMVRSYAAERYANIPGALNLLMDIAELKWHEYREDKALIISVEVKTVNGKPQAVAVLENEISTLPEPVRLFHDFMNSPEIQERLKNIAPEKLEEEIKKIVVEYNASLPPPEVSNGNDDDDEERDFPISKEELNSAYDFTQTKVSREDKKKMLAELLQCQPFLKPLCENAYLFPFTPKGSAKGKKTAFSANTIPDMILTLAAVYMPDTDLPAYDKELYQQLKEIAKDFVAEFLEDEDAFYDTLTSALEPNLYAFLAKTLNRFDLSRKEFKQKLTILMTWGMMIEEARREQHTEQYADFEEDEPEDECYDFDKKNLHILQLHVKLRGFRCHADVLVREDTTFKELHDFLNPLFHREDDHLYRFECDDGCTAVRDEEDIDDDERLSSECYVGHHLTLGAGAYYLFDYGDEWQHDITVKKIMPLDPYVRYPKVIKISGNIPEQYPDYDE